MTWHKRPARRVRGNKYGAKRTTVDGLTFDSQHEARRWTHLRLMVIAGLIQNLERQVRYPLVVNGVEVTSYRVDFQYVVSATGEIVIEDAKAKPTRTEAYVIRKKLMRACYSAVITEV